MNDISEEKDNILNENESEIEIMESNETINKDLFKKDFMKDTLNKNEEEQLAELVAIHETNNESNKPTIRINEIPMMAQGAMLNIGTKL